MYGKIMKIFKFAMSCVLAFSLLCVQLSVSAADRPLKQQEINEAITHLISAVERDYLHTEKRPQITERLAEALKSGEFDGRFEFGRLKIKLESMLLDVSDDASFELRWHSGFSGSAHSTEGGLPGALQVQHIEENIGYLAIDGDFSEDSWQHAIDKAFTTLSESKALIIDLRTAGLSTLSFSQYFLSHFIPAGQPISNITFGDQKTIPLLSNNVKNAISDDIPVYVLTSPFVAGTWEFVAHTLQQENRATIVGMPTIGLTTTTTTVELSEHLSIVMAYAELLHPATDSNWRKEGVMPDIFCDAKDAMNVTLELVKK